MRRKIIRLPEYDYTEPGGYFVTIVTQKRERLFGEIQKGKMIPNEWGEIAKREWFKTMILRPTIELFPEEFVVMPDHIHGIIWIRDIENDFVGVERCSTPRGYANVDIRAEQRSAPTKNNQLSPGALGVIVRAYKSAVSYQINSLRGTRGQPVWQRNYYEHIIRNEQDYDGLVEYIHNNPENWENDDPFVPARPQRL